MVTYIRSDLEFILDQIKIAEAHAAGTPLFGPGGLIPAPNIAWGLRTVDGTYNNPLPGREEWGAADNEFPGLLDPFYRPAQVVDMNGPAPGGLTAPNYNPSNDPANLVVDSTPRLISNLIVDQTIGNPAAVELFIEAGLGVVVGGVLHHVDENGLPGAVVGPTESLSIPNVSPDEGLSASFNSWFTLFGQFFDHGLDLVGKGGSGTVFVPLQPDDPLFDADGADNVPNSGDETNFMVLTRATVSAGPDNIMGTADDIRPINTTTSFVDQNQTYTSHPSHQVFLREYVLNGTGDPVATGKLIEGADGGMANWAEVKAQALTLLGIDLNDVDVGNVPLVRTDQYGNFIPGANGFPQLITGLGGDGIPNTADDIVVEGNPAAPVDPTLVGAVRTGHAFLADIAHTAVPNGLADGDITIGLDNGGGSQTDAIYDNELLDAHFMAGDGRVNENLGLTAVHHVFHAEHNRLVDHTKEVLIADAAEMLAAGATQAEAVAFLNEWLVDDVTAVPASPAGLAWDGERIFQAAKFGTEMQYQHLVFEEFARKVEPSINTFLVPDGFDVDMNPNIVAEFAHVVYRFGHSMLTESIDRYSDTFVPDHIGLIEGFLNPVEFNSADDAVGAGDIIRGMTRQVGNEIDEFVTGALRNNLLGLPLDLATINLARGRDTGVPSLNAARREFYEMSNQAAELRPYESWTDFAAGLKNEVSIINFVAAYGLHPLITSQTTAAGRRDAALTIITGNSVGGLGVPADAVDFLNGTGAWANVGGITTTGLDDVDLWIGGLAEEILPFGGMLGSTFTFVFESQMENLQSGDRFYYLQRLDGLHLFGEMENNSFASMIARNTNAKHLPSDVFSTPTFILEVDPNAQLTGVGDGNDDPTGGSILTPLVIRNDPSTAGADTHYLRYTGADHVVLGGTDPGSAVNPTGEDVLIGSIGDDTLYGDGGDDQLEGGAGNDIINAGDGDDIVKDLGGDDNIKAGNGNDVVQAGPGLDLVLGGAGKDFIFLGTDEGSEVFAGVGDDFIYGNKNAERILGNEGNDWIETGTFDGAPGDNFDEIFARDGVPGHDVFLGDGGFDEFIGEGGDDIMVGSPGRGKMVGMSGFDWATYKDSQVGVNADLSFPIIFDEAPTIPSNTSLDGYEAVEGLSGSALADNLKGSNDTAANLLPLDQGGFSGFLGSALDAAGIARIDGLQAVVGAGVTSFALGDIILGGAGGDTITGGGGDDIIDGDKWLNVRISVRENADGTGAEIDTADSMTDLAVEMFNGVYNPGQLVIVREILNANDTGEMDVAVYSGALSDYTITFNVNGTVTVAHVNGTGLDGIDTLSNIERIQFSDTFLDLGGAPSGQPIISDTTPTEGQQLTTSLTQVIDPNGINLATIDYQWQRLVGANWVNIAGATAAVFTPGATEVNRSLRIVVDYLDNNGTAEQVISDPTEVTGNFFSGTGGTDVFRGTPGADFAQGLGGADDMRGNNGDDILEGGNGNDAMSGGAGNDTTNGGDGNDRHIVENTLDIVIEAVGGGDDRVLSSAEFYALTAGAEVEHLTTANRNGTETRNLTGNEFGNRILANDGANILEGEDGNDDIFGYAGADSLFGGAGDDILRAGDGNDLMNGGTGNDRMMGVSGNDIFAFGPMFGDDTITDFDSNPAGGQDLIDLSALGITAAEFASEVTITQIGTRTMINIGADSIQLDNTNVAQINATDFLFG